MMAANNYHFTIWPIIFQVNFTYEMPENSR